MHSLNGVQILKILRIDVTVTHKKNTSYGPVKSSNTICSQIEAVLKRNKCSKKTIQEVGKKQKVTLQDKQKSWHAKFEKKEKTDVTSCFSLLNLHSL